MKKFIKLFTLLFVGACMIATTTSCDQFRQEFTPPDSVFQDKIDAYLPVAMQKMYEFDNSIDVVLYKQERLRQLETDSIFTSLTDQQLSNISAVLLKQQKKFGINDIVYEYKANKRIYSALPEAPLPSEEQADKTPETIDTIVQYKMLEKS